MNRSTLNPHGSRPSSEIRMDRRAWSRVYRERGRVFIEPQEDMPRIAAFFEEQGVKRILDLGCGSGRHLVFLAKLGFEVYGMDIAEEGVRIALGWLREEGLDAGLKVGDMYAGLPYRSRVFDAVVSIRALHHGRIEWIRKCIGELERVLRPGGWVFVTVKKPVPEEQIPEERRYGIRWIAPRTYIVVSGPERGLPHCEFDEETLLREFGNFDVADLWVDSEGYYCLLGRLKSKAPSVS